MGRATGIVMTRNRSASLCLAWVCTASAAYQMQGGQTLRYRGMQSLSGWQFPKRLSQTTRAPGQSANEITMLHGLCTRSEDGEILKPKNCFNARKLLHAARPFPSNLAATRDPQK